LGIVGFWIKRREDGGAGGKVSYLGLACGQRVVLFFVGGGGGGFGGQAVAKGGNGHLPRPKTNGGAGCTAEKEEERLNHESKRKTSCKHVPSGGFCGKVENSQAGRKRKKKKSTGLPIKQKKLG